MINYKKFKNPGSEYRSAPFWSWNDKLEKQELVRQINEMNQQGIGGFFMHPRGGLKDEYLGKDFMESVKACVDEAKELDMKAWLYDEDRFPSGNAAGKVTATDDSFRQKVLEMIETSCEQVQKNDDVIKIFTLKKEEKNQIKWKNITDKKEEEIRELDQKALVFKKYYTPEEIKWNDQSYADL
ncbi:MAG: hypothetical protein ACOCRB_01555, partial [Halanaerobiaceae bacterium]